MKATRNIAPFSPTWSTPMPARCPSSSWPRGCSRWPSPSSTRSPTPPPSSSSRRGSSSWDQRLWLMYKRGLVLSFSLRSSWRYKYNDGLARHPLPHANDNQTDSKWPSHGNPPQWIKEILQNLTLSTDEKETQDYVRWWKSKTCGNVFNILLQKPQQAPGANISSLVKFESLI